MAATMNHAMVAGVTKMDAAQEVLSNEAKADPQADKAAALKELLKRKPSEKGYRRTLKAYLEADAKYEKSLMKRLRRTELLGEQASGGRELERPA